MKLYVLVRKDISTSQQAVQAGHAVAEFCRRFPKSRWGYHTLVYLAVTDEAELHKWHEILGDYTEELAHFKEPYWDNSMTAFAVLGIRPVERSLQELELM